MVKGGDNLGVTANELIQYITDKNLIETVLVDIGCHSIKEYQNEYRCGQPGRNNKTSIVVKKDNLRIRIYQSDAETIKGNLITLIMTIKNISFVETNKYLHKLFNLKYDYKRCKKSKKQDPLDIFKKIKSRRYIVNTNDIEFYTNSIIEEYEPLLHIDWIKEGILKFTRKDFNIRYSYRHKRIVIPVRYWAGEENDYIGIMGRTTVKDWNLLDIPKYYPLKCFPKGINLYGLQENYKYIQEANEVCVYESEKAVLKRHSRLDKTGVAIGSHNLSDEQIRILIGLNVSITICYDKDISLNHIRSECEKFYGIRNVYYTFDKYDLLKEKDSPADASNKIFNYLFKHRVKYDDNERKEYYKWLEKKTKNLSK